MTQAVSPPGNMPDMSPPFVSFADQALYLAHVSTGHHAVVQVLWRYRRPVDLDALRRSCDNLAHGKLARLIRPALLPFGRHQWVGAPPLSVALSAAAPPLALEAMQAWADAQIGLPLDPVRGPAWTLTIQTFIDGSTVASLVVSHCVADGLTIITAVSEAARGQRQSPVRPAGAARRSATTLSAEFQRTVRDAPTTLRALTQLARTAFASRAGANAPVAMPVVTNPDDRTVVFPSAFMHVPITTWDARARSLGTDRLTLVVAITAAFAEALGRVRDDTVTLLIPVDQRERLSDAGGNGVALATLKLRADERHGDLQSLRRVLRATLLRTRREPDRLATLLPLVPFVPSRAFAATAHLALGALADLPVTCSYLGHLPDDVLWLDGDAADRLCSRGIDRPVARRVIEARQGVATLHAGVVSGFLSLNFVAYQPDMVTEPRHLRPLVERLLADYGLTGEFFDA